MQTANTQLATTTPTTPATVELGTLAASSPQALVSGASGMATALAEMIKSQNLSTVIQGKRYVQVEGWTTLAVMLGVTAREVETIEEDGIYIATVELVRMSDQAIISRASAECGDESPWNKRPKYARRSMAQTRATGKACRLAFSWIMKLAGYEATPAEEMPANTQDKSAETGNAPHAPTSRTSTAKGRPSDKRGAPMNIGAGSNEHKHLEAKITEMGLDRERVKAWTEKVYGVGHFPELTVAQYQVLRDKLPKFAKQAAKEETEDERTAIQNEGMTNKEKEELTKQEYKAAFGE